MQPVHIASPPTPVRSAIKNPTYQHNPPVPPTMLQTQQSSPTTKVVHRPRPSEVTGIAITMFIFDIFYLLDGISLMISYQVLSGLILLGPGIIVIISIYGLWKLRKWDIWQRSFARPC